MGPNSTAFLIAVVFGSTVVFFGMTVQATVRGSLKTKGVVGKLARVMVKCCCVGLERGMGGEGGLSFLELTGMAAVPPRPQPAPASPPPSTHAGRPNRARMVRPGSVYISSTCIAGPKPPHNFYFEGE